MKQFNVFSSMPSLATPISVVAAQSNQRTAGLSHLNAQLFLEMSKTAQLLSDQLFHLYENISGAGAGAVQQQSDYKNNGGSGKTSSKQICTSIDLTPISSGYNSLCASTDNLAKTSSRMSLLTDSFDSTQNDSTHLLRSNVQRCLFNETSSSASAYSLSSMSSTSLTMLQSLDSSSVSSVSTSDMTEQTRQKRKKPNETDQHPTLDVTQNFKTPHKSNATKQPQIPRIKETRRKVKLMTSFNSFKLRRAFIKSKNNSVDQL
jgi:hypothetical protein